MQTFNDVHRQFAEFFPGDDLKPYLYLVSKSLAEGHVCINLDEVQASSDQLPEDYRRLLFQAPLPELSANALVGTISDTNKPFILHNKRLYMQRYFRYESNIVEKLSRLIEAEEEQAPARLAALNQSKALVNKLFPPSGDASGDNLQLVAALFAVVHNFTIIAGGPGTGKTTTIARVLALLYTTNPELKVALAAPTGKAAVRMAESLRHSALQFEGLFGEQFSKLVPSTIHRLLRQQPPGKEPLDYDVVIVDEASMVDVALMAKLLDVVAPGARLILLGDKDQLASVEAGNLLSDLCKTQYVVNEFSEPAVALINGFTSKDSARLTWEPLLSEMNTSVLADRIVELQTSHRFNAKKGIGRLSQAVLRSDLPFLAGVFAKSSKPDPQVSISPLSGKNQLLPDFARHFAAYIREPDVHLALKLFNRYRILCAVREGDQGVYAINRQVEQYLRHTALLDPSREFYLNRPMIVTQNYPSLDLYNGDIGILRKDEHSELQFWFEDAKGLLRSILPGLISKAETAFAMTIHKSQGSEFEEVLVILPAESQASILTRELLYTAVTRARSKLSILTSEQVWLDAASKEVRRASGITERFKQVEIQPL